MNILPKILINRQAAGGDVLMTTPIVRKIFEDRKGQCEIDFFVKQECRAYLGSNPYIKNIHTRLPDASDLKKYDVIIDLDLVYEKNPEIHAVDSYALYAIGHTDFDRSLELHTTDDEKSRGDQFKEKVGNNYIVIHQRRFAWPSRNISEKVWSSLVKRLLSDTSLSIVQVGAPGEPAFAGNDRLIDARGEFTIPELKEVIQRSVLYIGVDSGPAHVAAATTTDMIVLYTSVREEYRRPLRSKGRFVPVAADIDCYGCHAKNPVPCTTFICHRGDIECINRFDPDDIADMAINLTNDIK